MYGMRNVQISLWMLLAQVESNIWKKEDMKFYKEKGNVMEDFWVVFGTAAQAAEYLAGTKENILLATGAKELAAFAPQDPARLYPRVLPTPEGIAACEAAGIPHRNIIAMQGPFSCQLNKALIEQFHIRYLVTKDGGAAGGFAEKVQAAAETGVQLVVLRRPEEVGETEARLFTHCQEILKWSH